MTEIKPCPFCGARVGKVCVNVLLDDARIECISCGGQVRIPTSQDSGMGSIIDNLVDVWNKRLGE